MKKTLSEIEVNEPIELTQKNKNTMQTKVVDLSSLTAAELKKELERREQHEKQEKEKAYKSYLSKKEFFVTNMLAQFSRLHKELSDLKEAVITESINLNNEMYIVKGKTPKDTKSFSIENENHTLKIDVENQERFKFTEEATVHIHSIKEIFKKKFESRNKGFYSLLDGLLLKGNKGEYDPKLLAKVRIQVNKLGDEELTTEFAELEKCQRVVGSATYCRAYKKDDKGHWQNINLQFSSL